MTAREFTLTYRRLYMPLCMYALRITENTALAHDAVQGSFMRVWTMLRDGHKINSLETYMYRAVRNTALTELSSEGHYEPMPDNLDEVTEEDIDTAERDARLWQAIDSMPPRRREIFLMSKRDGMTYGEIADELGLSVKTVENHIAKATASLRGNTNIHSFILTFL
ncbi:MAG: sigma-70 family RNA polymerase sigma factor [Muribaculaceae bacterium]|nr:sigma-70 family RNA polymerase sigma factor [Muribaculaceae bacterium]